MLRLLLGTLSLLFLAMGASAAPPLPDGWAVYPTPKPRACEWMRANHSYAEWTVRLENERLVIEPAGQRAAAWPAAWPKFVVPPPDGPTGRPCDDCVLRVEDGWLVGYNFGEWAGRLWWTDPNGGNGYPVPDTGNTCSGAPIEPNSRIYERSITNIVSLKQSRRSVLAISGLAHLSMSFGEVSRVDKRNGKWTTCRASSFGKVPYVAIADGEAWLVLADSGLFRMDEHGRLRRLATFAFLDAGLYPNSMLKLRDGTLYVGMRHFVARIMREYGGYRAELLLPKNRPSFEYEELIDDQPGPLPAECKRFPKPK